MYQPVPSSVDFPALEHEILAFWKETRAFEKLRRAERAAARAGRSSTARSPPTTRWASTTPGAAPTRISTSATTPCRATSSATRTASTARASGSKSRSRRSLASTPSARSRRTGSTSSPSAAASASSSTPPSSREQSIRLGQWMDWDDCYYTHTDNNIEHIWHFLKTLPREGLALQGPPLDALVHPLRHRPLAARAGRHRLVPRADPHARSISRCRSTERPGEHFLVWTTTPWTLPANVALAVHPDLEYVKVRQGEQSTILSPARPSACCKGDYEEVGTAEAAATWSGCATSGPFDELEAQAAASSTASSPGRRSARKRAPASSTSRRAAAPRTSSCPRSHGLPVIVPIDEAGDYVDGLRRAQRPQHPRDEPRHLRQPEREGRRSTALHDYTHRYPTCWRCGEELAFRLADEWFISRRRDPPSR